MKIFASAFTWLGAHKIIASLLGAAAVAAVVAGGWFGFQEYQRRQSAAFAGERLQAALRPPDPAVLARLVNFRVISKEITDAAIAAFPFLHEGSDRERSISHALQAGLLKKLLEDDKTGSQFPEDESKLAQLQKPVELLPPDFAAQLADNMTVTQTGPNTATLTARVNNPQFGRDFILNFAMKRGPDGWLVTSMLNASELAKQTREAMLERYAGLRAVYEEKNAATQKEMNTQMPLEKCTADAGTLSDGRTFLLIVHATARNKGNLQVNNVNMDTTIRGRSGNVIIHRFLNAAKPVGPGQEFDHRWTFDLDINTPVAQALLHDGPLQCAATWQTLTLNNGKVLHMAQVPNPDSPCEKEGHNHPADFCSLPLFLR